ncbi:uncharacterized protein LOC108025798 [Drosophila biarmipes]|uniref:uncharacterized protein LOC108025798 n=1 Tax=Drosophila biarmipes TaxID=125945 RepID=UPI0007E80E0C|nr:uncharacterized protein LOC108025798 [Drosophila biarmipes]
MEVFEESPLKNQVQDQNNNGEHQDETNSVKNLGLSSGVLSPKEIQGEKLPNIQIPKAVQDDMILSESGNLDHVDKVREVEVCLSVQAPKKYPSGMDPYQKQVLEDKALDPQRQDPPGNLRRSRVPPPMPSEETMRHSIADNLMEILVNMTNPLCRQQCLELLQAGDALQARSRVLDILQRIDEQRGTRR